LRPSVSAACADGGYQSCLGVLGVPLITVPDTITPWTLYFDGSVCNEGQGIDIVLVSPSDVSFDFSSRLKTYCTNNQAEYEALLFGLELLNCMGVKHVKAFGDSQLVVQQVLEEYQCFDDTLNSYLEKCWSIIHSFDEFSIRHISILIELTIWHKMHQVIR
jgi:ribonuclease HI